jgi:hypothetical protein
VYDYYQKSYEAHDASTAADTRRQPSGSSIEPGPVATDADVPG